MEMAMHVPAQPDLFGLWTVFPDVEEATFPSGFVRLPIVGWTFGYRNVALPVSPFLRPKYSQFEAIEVTWCGAVIWRRNRYTDADEWFAECRKISVGGL